ncbi:reverse transcriptase domain-containing protein [Loktanella salsilacus]|uniref:reverse transcriptase domain-containing protein n=1 Tax=Loktanella salsilacus TaxID=195913 RepID=UPI0030FA6AC1
MPSAISVIFGVTPTPPPELANINSLKAYLKASDEELTVIRKHRSKMYSHFTIPKKSGGVRFISAPNPRLLYLQRCLLEVFMKMHKPRKPVHGFVRQRSAITNAHEHLNRKHVLNIDLKDFFPTITHDRVSGLFATLGVPSDVRVAILSICCLNNRLPQGAPTSPVISNMICLRMDRQLMGYCKTRRIKYSRYADDLTFSLYTAPHQLFADNVPNPGKLVSSQISEELNSIIVSNGFIINEDKLRYFGPSSRKEVTGLIVSDIVNVPRKYVRNIRATIFDIEKNGYPNAQIKFSTATQKITPLSLHVRGKITWISQVKGINDTVYLGLARRYNALFPEKPLHTGNSKGEIRDLANWVLEKDIADPNKCSQGSAFFLEGYGLVTAFHCIEGASTIEVFHPHEPSQRYKVSIGKNCKHRDLALLNHNIPQEKFLNLEMADGNMRTGESVQILGYPSFGPGSSLHVREAKVVSQQTKSAVKQFVVDGKINQGNSGGPIVNQFDRVVGIAHKGGPGEAIDVAIAIREITKL